MRWRNRKGSENVEDRRADTGGGVGFPFPFPRSGGRLPTGGRSGGIGIVGILLILGLMLVFGIDPRVLLQGDLPIDQPGAPSTQTRAPGQDQRGFPVPDRQAGTQDDQLKQFVSVVLATTEEVWSRLFQDSGRRYQEPKLVLFRGAIPSGCGTGLAQMGPFYCPLDNKVYLDLSFYQDLKTRFRAPGEFAQAYVIAHEIGHHVQTLLGITDKVMRAKAAAGAREANAIQVRMELQADCLAGLWAYHAQKTLDIVEPGDIEAALNAASAIGDDRIMKRTQGTVVPDAFTHGSSEQRVRWFKRGFESGRFAACDTFAADSL